MFDVQIRITKRVKVTGVYTTVLRITQMKILNSSFILKPHFDGFHFLSRLAIQTPQSNGRREQTFTHFIGNMARGEYLHKISTLISDTCKTL